jgi:hypothetical protein
MPCVISNDSVIREFGHVDFRYNAINCLEGGARYLKLLVISAIFRFNLFAGLVLSCCYFVVVIAFLVLLACMHIPHNY